ncbi:MAG: geranylgeranylglyceryl/heptaprenylglyceryl phosphate synthase [archaeon]|nr:geranylgeranylglyceryl/heptaprenylglyceryl phosphate synthase [archaeon]
MKTRVYGEVLKRISEDGGLAFLVVDPPNQSIEDAGKLGRAAEEAGVDFICVGGSVGAQGELLDKTVLALKESSSLDVILFPGNIASISKHADAVYFMSLLNSNDPYYISGAQIAAAMPVKRMGLEVIPTSYVVVEPGRAVGWVGRVQLIPRDLPYLAAITALGGQFMGSKMVILESGGGASSPAPREMVSATKKMIDIPLVVAGGVRDEKFAFETIAAGADIVHVGTAAEETSGSFDKATKVLSKICAAVKKAGKQKL